MIRVLALISTMNLNLFPAKQGISAHYSPYMLIMQRNIDYNKYCQCEFGTHSGVLIWFMLELQRTVLGYMGCLCLLDRLS